MARTSFRQTQRMLENLTKTREERIANAKREQARFTRFKTERARREREKRETFLQSRLDLRSARVFEDLN